MFNPQKDYSKATHLTYLQKVLQNAKSTQNLSSQQSFNQNRFLSLLPHSLNVTKRSRFMPSTSQDNFITPKNASKPFTAFAKDQSK